MRPRDPPKSRCCMTPEGVTKRSRLLFDLWEAGNPTVEECWVRRKAAVQVAARRGLHGTA